jgi:hypothetical protein
MPSPCPAAWSASPRSLPDRSLSRGWPSAGRPTATGCRCPSDGAHLMAATGFVTGSGRRRSTVLGTGWPVWPDDRAWPSPPVRPKARPRATCVRPCGIGTLMGLGHEVPAPRELFGGPRGGGLAAVATTTTGFVVAGGWTGIDGHFDIGVWTSADGTSWTPLDGQPDLSPRTGESIRAISASGGGAGVILAGEADLGAVRQGVVWWSAEGNHWERRDVAGSLSVQQVVAVPVRFVALGIGADGAAASWRSADGRSWRPAGRLPAARGVTLTTAAADGASVIAGGVAGGPCPAVAIN